MKKVSLVLSGGGARGIAHIGVLEELEKQGYEIHSIAGTSMGALVGGIYASGKLEDFKNWLLGLQKKDIIKLVDFTLFHGGFIKGEKLFEELSGFVPDSQIQDLPIRFSATATDLMAKKEVLYTEGSLFSALRASIAIPNVLTPVKTKSALLVDGGVVNNVPINHAHRLENDLLIAVNVNADIPMPKKLKKKEQHSSLYHSIINRFNKNLGNFFSGPKDNDLNYFDILNLSYELMRDEMVKLSLEINPPDVLIEVSRDCCNIYDFYKADELIELGRQACIRRLRKYKHQE
jgi:NTE family protein